MGFPATHQPWPLHLWILGLARAAAACQQHLLRGGRLSWREWDVCRWSLLLQNSSGFRARAVGLAAFPRPFPVSQSPWRELEEPWEAEQLVLASPHQLGHADTSEPCREVHTAHSGQSRPAEEVWSHLYGFCPPAHLPLLHPASDALGAQTVQNSHAEIISSCI